MRGMDYISRVIPGYALTPNPTRQEIRVLYQCRAVPAGFILINPPTGYFFFLPKRSSQEKGSSSRTLTPLPALTTQLSPPTTCPALWCLPLRVIRAIGPRPAVRLLRPGSLPGGTLYMEMNLSRKSMRAVLVPIYVAMGSCLT